MSEHFIGMRDRLPEKLRHPGHWADETELVIRRHPFKTVGAAFAGGLFIGFLFRGRR